MASTLQQMQVRLARLRLAADADKIRDLGEDYQGDVSEYEDQAQALDHLLGELLIELRAAKTNESANRDQLSASLVAIKALQGNLGVAQKSMAVAQTRLSTVLMDVSRSIFQVRQSCASLPQMLDHMKGLSAPSEKTTKAILEQCKKLGVAT